MWPKPRRWGEGFFGGEAMVQEDAIHLFGVSAPGREGKRGWARPEANLLAVYRLWGVAVIRKEDQCFFLAALIALKYPALEVQATTRMCGVSFFRADLAAL